MVPIPPARDEEVELVHELLRQEQVVVLRGPPGSGRTAVATAVAADALRVSVAGCAEPDDALRAVGAALGVVPVGDERTVLDALRRRAPGALVVDDVDEPALIEPITRLVGGVPGLRVVVVAAAGERSRATELTLRPLPLGVLATAFPGADVDGAAGNPLLAELSAALRLPVADLPARLRTLLPPGVFPAGLPGPAPVGVPRLLLRDDPDRAWLRGGVLALLVHGLPLRAAPACPALDRPGQEAARAAVAPLLPLAEGGHLDAPCDPRDVLLLRQLARSAPPREAARCAAAAARLLVVCGQIDAARTLLRALEPPAGVERAVVGWADGDALLAAGDTDAAITRWREAAELFKRGDDRASRAHLLRRSADRLLARGQLAEAEPLFRLARNACRAAHDEVGVAATLRGTADLAVASGEWLAAATLHDEVEVLHQGMGPATPRLEQANLALGQASLWMARGELARAERLLDALGPMARRHPILAAGVARRRADLAARRGEHERAARLGAEAADGFGRMGEPVAQAGALRVVGEAEAAAGRLEEAREALGRAMRLQIGAQDLAGLARTLTRLALVEDARGQSAAARRRREQAASVRAALGVGEDDVALPPVERTRSGRRGAGSRTTGETTGSEGSGGEVTGSDGGGAEITGVEVTGSERTGGEITGSERRGPEVTGPEVTGPEVTGPEVTGPEVTGPEVTGPQVPGPEVTGPAAPEPAARPPEDP